MKNTGRPSEKAFEAFFKAKGKDAYLHRLVDAAEIRGRTGVVGQARAQPADYILIYNEQMCFAEVKSTTNQTAFAFSLLRSSQTAAARQILAAGGAYLVFAHSLALSQWYVISYQTILTYMADDKASIKWEDLETCRLTI